MRTHPLKYEREIRGWSQEKVAEKIGTTVRTVSRWERGLAMPYPYYREQLCALFGKNAQELGLVSGDEQHPRYSTEVQTSHEVQTSSAAPMVETHAARIYDPAIPVILGGAATLIGRESLLARLKEDICAERKPALTALVGLPGVGKTALAVALAVDQEIQEQFHDGILWVGLGTQPNVLGLLAHWGTLLGVSSTGVGDVSSREAWGMAIRSAIGTRRMLLIIDDAWKTEDALAFQVGGPNCAYLLTTRVPQVAFTFAREGAIEVPQLEEADGLGLMARFAPEIMTLEPERACRLVHLVGALPLALTLMGKYLASQVFMKQPRRLRAAITDLHDAEQRLWLSVPTPFIARSPSLPPGIPLSLHAAIAVSDQLISEEARGALHALSILPPTPNSFSEEMALAVTGVAVEVLDELSDAGLLESQGPGRYMLHQTIADYAKMVEMPDAYERLVCYGVTYVEEHASDYELLGTEINNILAVFDAAQRTGRQRELIRGVSAFANFLRARGLYTLATELLERAYRAAKSLESTQDMIKIACRLGELAWMLGANMPVEDYLQEGLVLARQEGNQEQLCYLLVGMGARMSWRGNYLMAEAYCQEGLAIARELGNDKHIVVLLSTLGWAVYEQQDYARAKTICHEGLSLARQNDNKEYICRILALAGWLETMLGNYSGAEAYLEEGLTIARQIQHTYNLGLLLTGLGWLAGKRKNYAEAERYTRQALVLARNTNYHELIYRLLTSLGWLAEKREAYAEADTYYQEALALAHQPEKPRLIAMILFHLGTLRRKQGKFKEARDFFHEMMKQMPEGDQDLIALAQDGLARVSAAQSS
ncbi:MAG: helix-turn-helix domain-containing protein [Ktedonobacteraceae bacterium]|nr:helix-turn-helix domain-containing protein [Ktedonobacteraceae bacterium]